MMETIVQKGKRAKRQRPMSTSSSLSSTVDGGGGGDYGFCDLGLSCGGGGGGGGGGGSPQSTIVDDEDMANCLILLAQGNRPKKSQKSSQPQPPVLLDSKAIGDEFECKTCNRRFSSFQALGGHRASHKKGTPAEDFQLDKFTNTSLCLQTASKRDEYSSLNISNNKSRVHECLICGAEFGSGQALGGHMRRHRPLPVSSTAAAASKAADELLPDQEVKKSSRLELLGLDLNLPAPEDDPGRGNVEVYLCSKKIKFLHWLVVITRSLEPLNSSL